MKKIVIILLCSLLLILLLCCDDPRPTKKSIKTMKKIYSQEESYSTTVKGTIVEFLDISLWPNIYEQRGDCTIQRVMITFTYENDSNGVLSREPGVYTDQFVIFSKNCIELEVDDEIEFIFARTYLYRQDIPIVQIKKDGELLLSIEEGKTSLFEWLENAKTV